MRQTTYTDNLVRETPYAVICESLNTPGNYYLISRQATSDAAKETVKRLNRSFQDKHFDWYDLRGMGSYS